MIPSSQYTALTPAPVASGCAAALSFDAFADASLGSLFVAETIVFTWLILAPRYSVCRLIGNGECGL